jgi:hypothetical protein
MAFDSNFEYRTLLEERIGSFSLSDDCLKPKITMHAANSTFYHQICAEEAE